MPNNLLKSLDKVQWNRKLKNIAKLTKLAKNSGITNSTQLSQFTNYIELENAIFQIINEQHLIDDFGLNYCVGSAVVKLDIKMKIEFEQLEFVKKCEQLAHLKVELECLKLILAKMNRDDKLVIKIGDELFPQLNFETLHNSNAYTRNTKKLIAESLIYYLYSQKELNQKIEEKLVVIPLSIFKSLLTEQENIMTAKKKFNPNTYPKLMQYFALAIKQYATNIFYIGVEVNRLQNLYATVIYNMFYYYPDSSYYQTIFLPMLQIISLLPLITQSNSGPLYTIIKNIKSKDGNLNIKNYNLFPATILNNTQQVNYGRKKSLNNLTNAPSQSLSNMSDKTASNKGSQNKPAASPTSREKINENEPVDIPIDTKDFSNIDITMSALLILLDNLSFLASKGSYNFQGFSNQINYYLSLFIIFYNNAMVNSSDCSMSGVVFKTLRCAFGSPYLLFSFATSMYIEKKYNIAILAFNECRKYNDYYEMSMLQILSIYINIKRDGESALEIARYLISGDREHSGKTGSDISAKTSIDIGKDSSNKNLNYKTSKKDHVLSRINWLKPVNGTNSFKLSIKYKVLVHLAEGLSNIILSSRILIPTQKKTLLIKALEAFEEGLYLDSKNGDIIFYTALVYAKQGLIDRAQEMADLALNLLPDDPRPIQLVILLYSSKKLYYEALQLVNWACARYDKNLNLLYTKLMLHIRNNNYDEIIATCKLALHICSSSADSSPTTDNAKQDKIRESDKSYETGILSVSNFYLNHCLPKLSKGNKIPYQDSIYIQQLFLVSTIEAIYKVRSADASVFFSILAAQSHQAYSDNIIYITEFLRFNRKKVLNSKVNNEYDSNLFNVLPKKKNSEFDNKIKNLSVYFETLLTLNPSDIKLMYLKVDKLQHKLLNCTDNELKSQLLSQLEFLTRRITQIDNFSSEAWFQLGKLLNQLNNHQESVKCLKTALSLECTQPIVPFDFIPLVLCLNDD